MVCTKTQLSASVAAPNQVAECLRGEAGQHEVGSEAPLASPRFHRINGGNQVIMLTIQLRTRVGILIDSGGTSQLINCFN